MFIKNVNQVMNICVYILCLCILYYIICNIIYYVYLFIYIYMSSLSYEIRLPDVYVGLIDLCSWWG